MCSCGTSKLDAVVLRPAFYLSKGLVEGKEPVTLVDDKQIDSDKDFYYYYYYYYCCCCCCCCCIAVYVEPKVPKFPFLE